MRKERFEVSTSGMRALQSAREPWQLAKELVSNAFDEAATECWVQLESGGPRRALLTVTDNGPGFANIEDAWTLLGHTAKRADPTVRGRFNLGEKEILSVALTAMVATMSAKGGYKVHFPRVGGRRVVKVARGKDVPTGTSVICSMPWGPRQVERTIDMLRQLLPPATIIYTVNHQVVPSQKPDHTVEATLDTVLQDGPGEPLRTTRRKTTLRLHRLPAGNTGTLFELGIPVQDIDCPWLVDVQQKVPMPPNRDVVRNAYLQDIYTVVLNTTAHTLTDDQASATWVRTAIEDKDVDPDAVHNVMQERYGKNVALWSNDSRANERATTAGYNVVHGRTLSRAERQAMEDVGLRHTSDIFPTHWGDAPDVPEPEWTDGMRMVAAYAQRLFHAIYNKTLTVQIYKQPQGDASAQCGKGFLGPVLMFNLGRLGKRWFESIRPDTTALLLHEFPHVTGTGHDSQYHKEHDRITGLAVHLALDRPEVFTP